MSSKSFLLVVHACFLVSVAAMADADGAQAPGARLDAWIQPLVMSRDVSGSIQVNHRGEALVTRSYGWSDLAGTLPNEPSTRFCVGSIAKQFTAAALLSLWDEGKVDLHAPITDLLPEMVPHHDITLHHLLTHQAGLARDLPDDASPGGFFLVTVAALPRLAEAGEVTSYSNCGFGVVAAAIERIAGRPFEEVVQDRVLRPLGLARTGFWNGQARGKDHADALDPGVGAGTVRLAPPREVARVRGAGALLSTPADLVRWLGAMRDGELLSDEARALLTTDHGGGRGYGFGVYQRGGKAVIGHDGVSHGFTAFAEWYPDEDLIVAYAGNVRTHAFEWLEDALPALVFDGPLPELPQIPASIDGIDPGVTGRYRVHDALVLEVETIDEHLELQGTGGYFTPLLRVERDRYWYRARFSWLEFTRNEEGRVTAVQWLDAHGDRFEIPRLASGSETEVR